MTRENTITIPSWLTSGLWKPTSLSMLEVIKGNVITLCFLVSFIGGLLFRNDMSPLHLLVAPFLDFIQRRLSWSLNTHPEKIYMAFVSKDRDHVFRNQLERARINHPVLIYSVLIVLVGGPILVLHLTKPVLSIAFVPYFTGYLVILSSSFALFAYLNTPDGKFNSDFDPITYVRREGSLRNSNLPYAVKASLILSYPIAMVLWFLSASQNGYTSGHLAGIVLPLMIILRTDQDIYNGKIYWISEALNKRKRTSHNA